MRLLGSARLSHKTDESTSIERQREQITLTAKVRGDTLIEVGPGRYVAEDTDVSGAISPFLREELGPWLTDPKKIAQWDGLIVAKVDRLTRSLSDFDELVTWLDKNGKTLISVSESLDLSTSVGRMFANLLAMFAQFERDRMSERRKEAAEKIKANGWWAGFGVPYGARPVKVDDHWELELDPITYEQLEKMAYDVIRGHSRTSIARKMNALQIPTPAGGKEWRQNTIADIFTNDKCVLDPELLAQVLDALDTTKQAWTKRGDAAMLLNVFNCVCGAPFHSKRYTSKGHLYEYYDCSAKCGERRVPMAMIDDVVEAFMTDPDNDSGPIPGNYAHYPVWRKVVSHGKSSRGELNTIERKLRTLDYDAPGWTAKQTELLAERKRLIDARSEPNQVAYEQIPGMTIRNYWPTLDKQGKRQLLLEAGVSVRMEERQTEWRGGAKVSVTVPVEAKFIMSPNNSTPSTERQS